MRYFDLHCDTLSRCVDIGAGVCEGGFEVDIKELSRFEKCVQVFACFVDDCLDGEAAADRFWQQYEIYKNTDFGDIKTILSIENLRCIGGNPENIYKFVESGVRIASLTWNGKNELASGVLADGGLTALGKEAVKILEREDVVVDVSHLNKQGFSELCDIASKPFIATHSNAFSAYPHKRNLTDSQLKIIFGFGGLVGLNFCPLFLSEKQNGPVDIKTHIDKMLTLGGEDSIAIGSDFDGCVEIGGPHKDLSNIYAMQGFYEYLRCEYGAKIADKIFYKNCDRFFRKNQIGIQEG